MSSSRRARRRQAQDLLIVSPRWVFILGHLALAALFLVLAPLGVWIDDETEGMVLTSLMLAAGLGLAWPILCGLARVTASGYVLKIGRAGLHLAGEPVIRWSSLLRLQVSGDNLDRRHRNLQLVLQLAPMACAGRRTRWAVLFGPSHRWPGIAGGFVHIDGSLWNVRAGQLREAFYEAAWRYGSAALEPYRHEAEQELRAESARSTYEQARAEAVRLIQAGHRASDPELKAAWAKADAAREKHGR